jgi:hypothetical protein
MAELGHSQPQSRPLMGTVNELPNYPDVPPPRHVPCATASAVPAQAEAVSLSTGDKLCHYRSRKIILHPACSRRPTLLIGKMKEAAH